MELVPGSRDGRGVFIPHEGQTAVPLRMEDELPSPLPQVADLREIGFTFQCSSWLIDEPVELQLFLGDEPVDCYLSCPEQPTNPFLAPDGAWCLLPKRPLEPGRQYRVEVRSPKESLRCSFQTRK